MTDGPYVHYLRHPRTDAATMCGQPVERTGFFMPRHLTGQFEKTSCPECRTVFLAKWRAESA